MVDCVVNVVDGPKLKCLSAPIDSPGTLSVCEMIHNVCQTKIEMRKKRRIESETKNPKSTGSLSLMFIEGVMPLAWEELRLT